MTEKKRLKVRLAVFLIYENPELLLMRRQNTRHRDGELGLPSGHVEEGETPEQAMMREAFEETLLVIPPDSLKLVHTQFNAESGTDRLYINLYFVPTKCLGEPHLNEPDQCSELVFVDETFAAQGWDLPDDVIPYVRTALEAYNEGRHRRGGGTSTYSEVGF